MMKLLLLFLAAMLVLSGCTAWQQQEHQPFQDVNNMAESKKAKAGETVRVDYIGRLENGEVFDQSSPGKPLEFQIGSGQLIKGFDEAVVGMKVGETKTVTIQPAQAYGEKDKSKVVEIPKERFGEEAGNLRVGMSVTGATGLTALITGIFDKNIELDFNPPLAGKALVFEITLREIVEAK